MIDTAAIRNKVLLLALSGGLVNQDSTDEPADILISRISNEINGQPYTANYDESEVPFEVPSNWSWCRLSDIGSTNIGLTYHPGDIVDDGTIVIRSSNIVNGKMDYSDLVKVNCQIRENQYLDKNDIVICARNGSKALVGKCAIFDGNSEEVSFGAFMAVFRTQCYKYVYYYLNTPVFRRYFSNDDTKQINQVTQNILKRALIPIPPIEEQGRIVEKVEAIFSLLDTIDNLQSCYFSDIDVLRSKVIDAGIQGKLTNKLPEDGTADELYVEIQTERKKFIKEGKIKKDRVLPEIDEGDLPFEIPENWKWVRLGNIATILGGKRIPAGRKLTTENTGHKYIRVSEMKDRSVNADSLLYVPEDIFPSISQYIINKEDVYITVAGTIGKVGKIPKEIDGANLTENADRIVFSLIDQDYLIYCLLSSVVQKQIEMLTTQVAQPKLAIKRIQEFLIPLPPIDEEKRIAKRIDDILQIIM